MNPNLGPRSGRPAAPSLSTSLVPAGLLMLLLSTPLRGADERAGMEFFEKHVRPVLVEQCYKCHSSQAEKGVKGGLNLETREGLLKGGENGPAVVPGDVERSLLIKAVRYTDENLQMPPKNRKLGSEEIQNLEAWVRMGAPDPRSSQGLAKKEPSLDAAHRHWAYQPVREPALPKVKNKSQVRTPVDAFLLASLEPKGLRLSPEADRRTLIRRVSFDLTGLPPGEAEVAAFLADRSPDAYEKLVDRLLASPRYGERWGRYWLDIARYADTKGYVFEEERRYPYSYTYRDYVIRAFNQDLPYDRFLEEQLAADLLPLGDDKRPLAAMGFLTLGRRFLNNPHDIIDDRLDVICRGIMGLTIGCARCHDHKFDPILQTDYYRLQAFFANTAARDDVPLASVEELALHRERLAEWEGKTAAVRAELKTLAAPHRKAILKDFIDKYPDDIRRILDKPEVERTPFERQMAWKARQYIDPASHEYLADDGAVAGHLKGEEKQRWEELHRRLKAFDSLKPPPLEVASAMMDLGEEAPKTFLLRRGLYDSPREEVQPGLLEVLYPTPAAVRPPGAGTTRRRTALAELLTSPDNPLTSRVIVNRVWQYHFGRGLVGTPSDFGLRGDRPTHPELLDWLA
ncbi:MAG TPA: hypothetical protein DCM86_13905, partial [Verrucomicrobiales bacterium]|nr:hypothetical protein [Verrucomicrobiales bacterium]